MAPLAPYQWLLIVAVSTVVLLGAFRMALDAPMIRQLFKQFFLLVFLPLLVLLGLPLLVVGVLVDLDERVWQALIAGLVIVAGWLSTAIFGQIDRTRARAERLRDVHKALFAEIRFALSAIDGDGEGVRWGAELLRRMEADEGFVPFVPRERHDQIFDSVIGQIDVLPRQTIDPIVAYYGQIKAVSQMAEDMRGERVSLAAARAATGDVCRLPDDAGARVRTRRIRSAADRRICQRRGEGRRSADRKAQ